MSNFLPQNLRLRKIDVVDAITLITLVKTIEKILVIEEITTIKNIENVENIVEVAANQPQIYNVTMTNADEEYIQGLPVNCKKFLIHTRDESPFRLAFETGKVAAPTEPYFTVLENQVYYEDNLKVLINLYFASSSAGKVIEIIAWS